LKAFFLFLALSVTLVSCKRYSTEPQDGPHLEYKGKSSDRWGNQVYTFDVNLLNLDPDLEYFGYSLEDPFVDVEYLHNEEWQLYCFNFCGTGAEYHKVRNVKKKFTVTTTCQTPQKPWRLMMRLRNPAQPGSDRILYSNPIRE